MKIIAWDFGSLAANTAYRFAFLVQNPTIVDSYPAIVVNAYDLKSGVTQSFD